MLLYRHAMNPTEDQSERQQLSAPAQAAGRLYERGSGVLLHFLTERFRLAETDAVKLLCRVCSEAMSQKIRNREAWVVGASCNGAQTLRIRRDQGTAGPPPDTT